MTGIKDSAFINFLLFCHPDQCHPEPVEGLPKHYHSFLTSTHWPLVPALIV